MKHGVPIRIISGTLIGGQLYDINRNQGRNATYGPGHRSINMIEERRLPTNWTGTSIHSSLTTFRNNSRINGGVNLRRNRTEYYSEVKGLLGGDYWVDIDKFAERDMGGLNPIPYQNDMEYYENTVMHALPKKEINTGMITTEMYSTHAHGLSMK